MKKQSSYSEIEDHAKPTTGKKLKGLGDTDAIQITEHAGYLIPKYEYGTETEAAAAANDELEKTYGISPEKFRRKKTREASSENTTGRNRGKNGAAGTEFKYDTAAIISHLKTKRSNTVAKAGRELEYFYEELGLEYEMLSLEDRIFIVDTEGNGSSFLYSLDQN